MPKNYQKKFERERAEKNRISGVSAPAAPTPAASAAGRDVYAPTAPRETASSAASTVSAAVGRDVYAPTAPRWVPSRNHDAHIAPRVTPASAAIPDAYGEAYRAALEAYTHPEPFTWDPDADPAYQAYRKTYAREGRRAGEDTLGQYAAMTGGVPSTAAVTAAQQAGDYYAAQLADRVPELYRLAYSMYADADARRLRALEALRDARGDELARWDAQRGYETDARDFAYQKSRDERDFAYQRERDARSDALATARLAAANGDFSGLAALGVDVTRAAGTRWAYGADGSVYDIGSARGQSFVDNAQPGQTMTGGDGSVWVKQADGSVVITRDGKTWLLAAPAAEPARGYSGGGRAKKEADDGEAEGGDYPIDLASVEALGYGPISEARLAQLVESGAVEEYLQGGKRRYRRRDEKRYDAPRVTEAIKTRNARLGL